MVTNGSTGNEKKSTKINSTKPAGNSKLFHVKIL